MADDVDLSASLAPPGEAWDQGDIVEEVYFGAFDKKMPAVLLTPACDIEQDKLNLWTFVALYPDVEIARASVAKEIAEWKLAAGNVLSKNQRTQLSKALLGLVGQRLPRFHWIPVTISESAGHVADFTCVTALSVSEVRAEAKRVATLRSSWREQLAARYAAFMGRVGTDDFKEEALAGEIERLVDAVVSG